MNSRFLFIIILLISDCYIYSQNWESIGPPGGRITALAIDPQNPQNIFAKTTDGFVFKSNNSGITSELVKYDDPLSRGPVINPINSKIIISGSFVTTDGGISWNKMEISGWSYAFHPVDENIIYAINGYIDNSIPGKNIIVSYNKGLNWDTLSTFTNRIHELHTTSINKDLLFVSEASELLRSTDGGSNWNIVLNSSPGDVFGNYIVSNNDSMIYLVTDIWDSQEGNSVKFYRSTNLGNSWEIDSLQEFIRATPVNSMKIDPLDPNTIYLVTGDYLYGYVGDIWKSTDRGNSWLQKNTGLPNSINRYLYSLVINPLDPQNLYVGTYGWGVYKTINGGESWQWTNLTKAPVHSIYVDKNDPYIIYACTIDEGVLKTTNGGLEWEALNLSISQTVLLQFYKITFNPNNSNIGYIASQYGVFKSTDGGNNWQITSLLGDFDHSVDEISIHPENSDIVYAGIIGWLGRKDLYRSVDGGNSWTRLNITKGEEGVVKVLFDPVNLLNIYVAALSKGIFKSSDNGATWNTINNGLQLTDPPLIKAINSLDINNSDPSVLYSDNGGVVKTTNAGESWFRIDDALLGIDNNIEISRVAYVDGKIYASSNNFVQGDNTYYYEGGLYFTSNEGLSWSKLGTFQIGTPGPGEVKFNPADPKEIFISTMTGIYKGRDSVTSVKGSKNIPESIHLYQNFPNPFNPTTTISYALPQAGKVTLKVYDILGKEITTLVDNNMSQGYHTAEFDGSNYASGLYFVRLIVQSNETKPYIKTIKMMLTK